MAFDIALQGQDGDLTSVFVPHCGVGGWMVLQYLVDIYIYDIELNLPVVRMSYITSGVGF